MTREKDEERDHRIHYEIIVDAYDEYEQAMGWYIHMNDNLEFPIKAKVKLRLRGGKTEEKAVQIVEIDPKSEDSLTLRLGIAEGKSERVQYISPEFRRACHHPNQSFKIRPILILKNAPPQYFIVKTRFIGTKFNHTAYSSLLSFSHFFYIFSRHPDRLNNRGRLSRRRHFHRLSLIRDNKSHNLTHIFAFSNSNIEASMYSFF